MLSPYGGSSNNYNHQGMQNMVESEILWMMENFNIDKNRIYMVGGSMGGATGAIYANNHLDPTKPMVAASASASGILDCERRAIEMDGNNSMIEWFGGEWYEVPFEYHRNSAVYFADSTQSMHYNLQHTPLYLDFGVTEPHRTHAEDLYDLLDGYNENMWIDTDPTGSHGYSVFDENHVCDWLSQFELIDNPNTVNVNLDEPSRAYWVEAKNQQDSLDFISTKSFRLENQTSIIEFENSDSLVLYILDNEIQNHSMILETPINTLGLTGPLIENLGNNSFNFDGAMLGTGIELSYNLNNNIIWIRYCVEEGWQLEFDCEYEHNDLYNLSPGMYNISILLNNINEDINGDGIWNVLDVVLVINYIFELNTLNEEQLINADLNQDGIINILDIVNVANYIIDN